MKNSYSFYLLCCLALILNVHHLHSQSKLNIINSQGKFEAGLPDGPFQNTVLLGKYTSNSNAGAQVRFESNAAGFIDMGLNGDGNFVIENSDNPSFILNQSGKVGIGTTTPDQTLHIHKGSAGEIDANANSIAILENNTFGYLNILTPDNIASAVLFGQPSLGNAAGGILFDANFADGLEFRTGGNIEHLIGIDASGNMGIGTATPQATLDVVGDTKINGRLDIKSGNNLIIGSSAGSGSQYNTIIGISAGKEKTGLFNTFIGLEAGEQGATGMDNTFVGRQAGRLSTGSNNTYLGNAVNQELDSGNRNTVIGESAAGYGDNNTVLGQGATAGETILNEFAEAEVGTFVNNATAIGRSASVVANNKMRLGNGLITVIEGQVDWSFPSDGRFKKNIRENIQGLDFILNLRPVTYHFDVKKYNDHFRIPTEKDADNQQDIKTASKVLYSGFIAQEVEETATKLDYDFSGLVKPQNEKDNYGLRYGTFVVPLVKATQEQQTIIEEQAVQTQKQQVIIEAQAKKVQQQQEILAQLIAEIQALKTVVEQLSAQSPIASNQKLSIVSLADKATLQQNQPNPFNGQTTIQYFLPEATQTAQLQINDQNGRVLKVETLQGNGHGQITLDAKALPAGTYSYSLLVDGQLVETKQMILAK